MSEHDSPRPIVVGIDGSTSSGEALDWAVSEATAMGCPLRIVHVLELPRDRSRSVSVLAPAVSRAGSMAAGLAITSTAVVGDPAPALLHEAEGAELLVIGSRAREGRAGRLLGPVGQAVVREASCPVVVVHPRQAEDPARLRSGGASPRVMVVLDDPELSAAAIRFAFEAAARRRAGVLVVRPWTPPFAGYPRLVLGLPQLVQQQRRKTLASLVHERRRFPEVEVEVTLVHDKDNHHGRAVVDESRRAAMVVLGHHGHHGFLGRFSDDAGRSVVARAHCPVAVVRLDPVTASRPVALAASSTGTTSPSGGAATSGEVSSVLRWLRAN